MYMPLAQTKGSNRCRKKTVHATVCIEQMPEEHGRIFAQQPASSFMQGYHLAVDKSVREAHIECVASTL